MPGCFVVGELSTLLLPYGLRPGAASPAGCLRLGIDARPVADRFAPGPLEAGRIPLMVCVPAYSMAGSKHTPIEVEMPGGQVRQAVGLVRKLVRVCALPCARASNSERM